LTVDTIREAVQGDDATAVASAKRGPQLTDRRNLADLDGLDSVDE
jgi:hypothetical protein